MSQTKSKLIQAASDLFYQHGFQAVGLDQILDDVGITKTAFYKHFESKDELIIAVLNQRDQTEVLESTQQMHALAGDDPRLAILVFFDLLEKWFASPDFRGCLFMNAATEFPSPNDPIHQAAAAHGKRMSTEFRLLAVRAGAPDPDLVTDQIMLLVRGAIAARHTQGSMNSAATAKLAATLLLERHLSPVSTG